ncbi:hypothetical protein HDF16_003410 [Granulicella aggregans]|uniref:Sce7726 family protein n=2 Tax=Granulicella aggregans TaxID=474949 RepID=A0A7W8E4M7_9BACT|nr:hypothetical protein [Granulicella aggregans]
MQRIHGSDPDTLVVEEVGLCQGLARIDIAVINGSVHGYELKSERDTLDRLPAQLGAYSQALEFVTVVAAKKHLAELKTIIPPWWGIWVASQKGQVMTLTNKRAARPNPQLSALALAQFLWRDEVLQFLVERRMDSGLKSKSRQQLWDKLAANATLEELSDLVRKTLKARGASWRSAPKQELDGDLHPLSSMS